MRAVQATKIFARRSARGWFWRAPRQVLVYEMQIATDFEVAMILPIPTPAASRDDAVRFVSLAEYDGFFADIELAFEPPAAPEQAWMGSSLAISGSAPKLVVHAVGAFVASFVPTAGDFTRLDPRFRVPPGTLETLPEYRDWGFAVFQLKAPGNGLSRMHPMAFEFPTRRPSELFFPTVHVHDGQLHAEADFSHALYGQGIAATTDWHRAGTRLRGVVDGERAKGLVDLDGSVAARGLVGRHPNRDVWAPLE